MARPSSTFKRCSMGRGVFPVGVSKECGSGRGSSLAQVCIQLARHLYLAILLVQQFMEVDINVPQLFWNVILTNQDRPLREEICLYYSMISRCICNTGIYVWQSQVETEHYLFGHVFRTSRHHNSAYKGDQRLKCSVKSIYSI